MSEQGVAFIVGTAGSGKTVLTAVLRRYLEDRDANVIVVNLDPAVQRIPYTCEVDVREYVDIQDIIDKYELGPNGAMITASDLIASEISTIKEDIDDYRADITLIDTPGQLEVFVYRSSGPIIVREFVEDKPCACVFLMDSNLVRNASSFISLNFLAVSTQFRLALPMVYALTKTDLIDEEDLEKLERWAEDIDIAFSDITSAESPLRALTMSLADAIRDVQAHVPLIPISSLKETGLEDLSGALSRALARGDDWTI